MKQNTPTKKAPPFCLQCALCIIPAGWTPEAAQLPNSTLDTPRCRIAQMMDVVSGSLFYPPCVDMRNPQGPCKFEGVLFKAKVVLVNDDPKPPAVPGVEPEATGLN